MGDSLLAECKPGLAMVVSQCIYAAMALSAKAAFARGMSPMVFSVYRQATAALVLAPLNITARRGKKNLIGLGLTAFFLVFVSSLVGATINQYFYYTGLSLSSSSMAMAMSNLTPAITFVIAASVGLEKVEVRSMRSMAKVFGTVTCVGGAVSMAFFKGPRLLNMEMEFHKLATLFHSASKNWIVGSLLLMGSSCCWSLWLVLQVPICRTYLDPLSLSIWMCVFSTFLSAALTFFLEPDISVWKIHSTLELSSCFFAGVFGSGVTFYLQSWTISLKGPLYSAMFNPLGTVITTISACLVLHEQLHIGSLVAAVAVVGGLYIVLWGKAKDIDPKSSCSNSQLPCVSERMTVVVDPELRDSVCDLQKPLLGESLGTQDNQMEN
ncbi:unnamed protein product [Musa acuminata subsp. burmannicoides]